MGRKNHPRHRGKHPAGRYEDYTVDYIHLPQRSDLKRIILEPTKTICINRDAPPWGGERVVRKFDDYLLKLIQRQRYEEG